VSGTICASISAVVCMQPDWHAYENIINACQLSCRSYMTPAGNDNYPAYLNVNRNVNCPAIHDTGRQCQLSYILKCEQKCQLSCST